jgi:hypothetical protein
MSRDWTFPMHRLATVAVTAFLVASGLCWHIAASAMISTRGAISRFDSIARRASIPGLPAREVLHELAARKGCSLKPAGRAECYHLFGPDRTPIEANGWLALREPAVRRILHRMPDIA